MNSVHRVWWKSQEIRFFWFQTEETFQINFRTPLKEIWEDFVTCCTLGLRNEKNLVSSYEYFVQLFVRFAFATSLFLQDGPIHSKLWLAALWTNWDVIVWQMKLLTPGPSMGQLCRRQGEKDIGFDGNVLTFSWGWICIVHAGMDLHWEAVCWSAEVLCWVKNTRKLARCAEKKACADLFLAVGAVVCRIETTVQPL